MAHEEYKSLPLPELQRMFAGTPFKTPPLPHQLVSLAWAIDGRDRVMLWHSIGTGKSFIALWLAILHHARRVLIVCPNSVVRGWREQIALHTAERSAVLSGPASVRQYVSQYSNARFHVINYEGLKTIFGVRESRNGKNKWQPSTAAIAAGQYDMLIVDESHHVADPSTLQTAIASLLSRMAHRTVLMTGTPIARSELDLWAQFYVLDGGRALGGRYFAFRTLFFFQAGYRWLPRRGARQRILDRITPATLRYEADECMALPDLIVESRHVEITREQRAVYNQTLAGLQTELATGTLTPDTIAKRAAKLLQIPSGFFLADDGRAADIPGRNPKLDELSDLLTETGSEQVLVCHGYEHEGRLIERRCRAAGLSFASLRGEIKDKENQYERFRSGAARVLIFHPASAGEGLNLQQATTIVFFSFAMLGAVRRQQAIGRIHRTGQTRRCLVLDLVADDTLDDHLYSNLAAKVETSKLILDYIRGGGAP